MDAKGAIKKGRKFKNSWLEENCFKGWLAPHPTENKAICLLCNKSIRCTKTDLVRHSQGAKHIEKVNCQSLDYINNDNNDNNSNNGNINNSHIENIKRAEIQLSAFFAEHNVAFCTADHLTPVLKKMFIDSKIAHDLSLARSKCTKIVKEVIAKFETEKLVDILRNHKFSILIDESTDIADTKTMCILVRYVSPTDRKVKTQLLDLLSLDATNCSAKTIFERFKKLLDDKNVPVTNIIGMASDNASVMIGCHNSFAVYLKLEVPNLILLKCICYSSAIIASKACKKLPESCENLIRNIVNYISGSPKRSAVLREFQDFFEVERNKMLKLSNTRWLVLHKCVIRLLDNWEVLKSYFILAVAEDKLQSADTILTYLNDISIKTYLLFLKYSLHFFNSFNALFQSRTILIHKLYESSQKLIRQFAENFIIPEALADISTLNVDDERNIQHLNDIYVGHDCESLLAAQPSECAQKIKLQCLEFYKTAVKEMLKRLPYNDTFFKLLTFIDPKVALYSEGRNKIKDLTDIAVRIGKFNTTKLEFEWRILPSTFNDSEKQELLSLEIEEMWKKILEVKGFDGEKMFSTLDSLIEIVFSLPHSNAEAERIFSIVSDVKSKKRNRLSNDTVSAICSIRSSFQTQGINCFNFQVEPRHLELHNAENLYTD